MISIITPNFNRERLIDETAKSILNQTNSQWEWIIIDDGSIDNSWKKLLSLQATDDRIRVFQRNREPKGACTCRNIGIEKAQGDYLLFLDSDDVLSPTAIETRINYFRNEDIREGVLPVFPSMTFEQSPKSGFLWEDHNHSVSWLEGLFSLQPITGGTGPVWTKTILKEIGGWREDLTIWQDVELHLRAFFNGKRFEAVSSDLIEIHIRMNTTDSISHTNYQSAAKIESRFRVLHYILSNISPFDLSPTEKQSLQNLTGSIILNQILTERPNASKRIRSKRISQLLSKRQYFYLSMMLRSQKFKIKGKPIISSILIRFKRSVFKNLSGRKIMTSPVICPLAPSSKKRESF